MIYKILNDYKDTFNFRKNYLKHFTKRSKFLLIAIVILNSAIIIACSFIFQQSWPLMFLGGTILLVLPISKSEVNRIVKEHYDCKNRFEVSKLLKQNFELKLRQKNIEVHNIEQVDYLIYLIEQNLVEMKPGLYIKSGICAGVLGPLWLCYLDAIFKFAIDIDEATKLFIIIFAIFIMIFFLYLGLRYGFMDDILHSDYYKLKSLRNFIKDYKLIYLNKKLPDIA